jgi:DNA-binding CsgD family transcriptional regulator
VVVLGEAGIGKSRLVRELAAAAQDRGVFMLAGRAVQGAQPAPYRPLAEAVLSGCRRFGLPGSAELVPYRPALGRLVPEWHRPGLAESAESTVVLGEGLLRLLHAWGGDAGALLVLEDMHWADPESLAVLEYLADHAVEIRLACVATARPEPSPGVDLLRSLVARRAAAVVELSELSAAEVAAMAGECLRTTVLPAGLDRLLARAEGVPFLVEELLAAAVDGGGLVREGGRWVMRPGGETVVPQTLSDNIAQRMDALDPAGRQIARAAALFGRRFDPALAAALVERSVDEVLGVLRRCVGLQLVSVDAGGFQFRHELTRDAVLAGFTPGARSVLARRACAVLEGINPGLPGQWCQLAAELSALAGDVDRAARLLLTAGQRAVADGALATAAGVLGQAHELVPDGSELAPDIDELRTEVAALTGEVDTAFAIGDGLARRMTDPARRARVHLRLAQAASAASRWVAAQEQLGLAGELTASADDVVPVRVDALAAHVLLGAARPDEAAAVARRTLKAAERLDLAEPACQALEVLGRVARIRDLHEAEMAFARQLDIATGHDLPLWIVRAMHELGTIDMLAANRADRLHEARILAAEAGALSTAATIDLQLAGYSLVSFDVAGCLDAARRCQDAARRWSLGLLLAVALGYEARAYAIAGDRAAMERAIAGAVAVGRPEPQVHSNAWSSRAMFRLLREDHDGAIAAYDTAVSFDRRTPMVPIRGYWGEWALLRTVHDRDGDQARDEARMHTPAGDVLNEAMIGYGDAAAAGRSGSCGEAEVLFAAARAKISIGRTYQARRHLAERLVAGCAVADGWGQPVQWLTEAAGFFRGIGQTHVERGCRSLLRKAGARLPRREHGHHHVPPALAAMGITDREADVLALVAEGLTSKEIAARLYLSARTVDKHVERLLAKTGVSRRAELRQFST